MAFVAIITSRFIATCNVAQILFKLIWRHIVDCIYFSLDIRCSYPEHCWLSVIVQIKSPKRWNTHKFSVTVSSIINSNVATVCSSWSLSLCLVAMLSADVSLLSALVDSLEVSCFELLAFFVIFLSTLSVVCIDLCSLNSCSVKNLAPHKWHVKLRKRPQLDSLCNLQKTGYFHSQ